MLMIIFLLSLSSVTVLMESTDVALQSNSLGLKLLQHVPSDENIMISPFSISTAVAMLNTGAAGGTKSQIDAAFGWSDISNLSEQFRYFIENVTNSGDSQLKLMSNNRLYVDLSFTPLQSYSDGLSSNFQADVEAVNFRDGDNSATVDQINEWVEEKTNDKITDMFDEISSDTRAILINTIYFKGSWTYPFNQQITKETFYLDEKYALKVDTMHLYSERLQYYDNNDIELVKLPYDSDGGSRVSMVVIKPKTRAGLSSLETKINYRFSEVSKWLDEAQYTLVDLSMPKFQFKSGIENMKEMLQNNFGVLDVFNPSKADLSGVSLNENLFVSFIMHKSFISVNENGTEAAAATAIGIEFTSVEMDTPKKVQINQPFMFFIYDETNEVILFVGRLIHPETANDAEKYLESNYIGPNNAGNSCYLSLVALLLIMCIFIVYFN